MSERRKFRMEAPDSMKGDIDTAAAHDLISPADRQHLRARYQLLGDTDLNAALNRASEWIERYLRADEHKPLPSMRQQRQSREALLLPTQKLHAAMKNADCETRKRLCHYLADHPPKGAPKRDAEEDDFDYGGRVYSHLRRNLDVLAKAVADSKRDDDAKGQAGPSTYLLYQLTLIWIGLTGYRVTKDPKTFPQGKAARFCEELLKIAKQSSAKADAKKLVNLIAKPSKATFTAISRKLARDDPERDRRLKEKRDRSDNDTRRERKARD